MEAKRKELPKGWVEATLGEIIKVKSGDGLSAKNRIEGIIPVYGGNGVTGYHNSYNTKNSTLVIGRVGYYCGSVHITPEKSWITDNAFLVHFNEEYFNFYFLKHLLIAYDLRQNISSTAQPVISGGKIYPIKISFPPLPEQERIVVKLDALFGSLEQLNAGLDKIPTLLKNFKQAVLTQAVTGKLTEEWRVGKELGNINLYYDSLINEKSEYFEKQKLLYKNGAILKRPTKSKILNEVDDWELDSNFSFPSKWKICRFNHISYKIGDVDHKMPKNIDQGFPYLSTGDMKDVNNLDFFNCRKISDEDYYKLSSKIKPEFGDIIFPRYGTIGRNIYVDFKKDFLVSYSCAIIKNISKLINSKYVYYVSISSFVKNEINKHVVQTTQANIGIASIEKFLFPLCCFEEQIEIVNRVESLFTRAEALEARYHALKEKVAQLPQAILAKAFKGELVEQLPTDGDAKELLKEILELKAATASRASASAKKKKASSASASVRKKRASSKK